MPADACQNGLNIGSELAGFAMGAKSSDIAAAAVNTTLPKLRKVIKKDGCYGSGCGNSSGCG